MRTYRVTLADRSTFLMLADMAEPSANIKVNWDPDGDEDRWCPTPYQSANFARIETAAQSCAVYMAEKGDCTEVVDVDELLP